MPRYTATKKRGGRRATSKARTAVVRRRLARQHGGNFWKNLRKFAKKANKWLKKTKAVSKGANFAADIGIMPGVTKNIGKAARMAGYGRKRTVRRRRRRGGNLGGGNLGGGSLKLAGSGKRRTKKNMRVPPMMY